MADFYDLLRKKQDDESATELLPGGQSQYGEGGGYSRPITPERPLNPGDEYKMYTPTQRMGIGDLNKDSQVLKDYLLSKTIEPQQKEQSLQDIEDSSKKGAPLQSLPSSGGAASGQSKPDNYTQKTSDIPHPQTNVQGGASDEERAFYRNQVEKAWEESRQASPAVDNPIGSNAIANTIAASSPKMGAPTPPQLPSPIGNEAVPGVDAISQQMAKNGIQNMKIKMPVAGPSSSQSTMANDISKYLLQKYAQDSDRYLSAQKAQNSANLISGIGRGFDKIASGIAKARANPEPFTDIGKNQAAMNELQVKQNAQSSSDLEAAGKLAQAKKNAEMELQLGREKIQADSLWPQVHQLGTELEPKQQLQEALDQFNGATGYNLGDLSVSGDSVTDKKGKDVDLAGVNVRGIGRFSFYSPEARATQAAIDKLFNIELKDRNGARITVPELDRLKREFMLGKWNSEADMIKGMKQYADVLQRNMTNIEARYPGKVQDMYKAGGGLTSAGTQRTPPNDRVIIVNPSTGRRKSVPNSDLGKWLNTGEWKAE